MATKAKVIKALKTFLKRDIAEIKEAVEDHMERKVSKKEFIKILKSII